MENRYYIIDYGVDMEWLARVVIKELKKTPNAHYVPYLTDFPNGFMVTETNEDDFLLHFASSIKTKDNE